MLILVCVEDSHHGEAAARAGVRYGEAVGVALHAVHVVNLPKAVYTMFETIPLGTEELASAERAAVWNRVGPILDAADVPVRRIDLDGVPSEEIIHYATEVEADLIIVGNRHRSETRRLFLGSTSSRVLQLARCDVLLANSEEQAGGG